MHFLRVPRTSVLFCAASFHNSSVKNALLLLTCKKYTASFYKSIALLHCWKSTLCSSKKLQCFGIFRLHLAHFQRTRHQNKKSIVKKCQHQTFAHEDEKVGGRTFGDDDEHHQLPDGKSPRPGYTMRDHRVQNVQNRLAVEQYKNLGTRNISCISCTSQHYLAPSGPCVHQASPT